LLKKEKLSDKKGESQGREEERWDGAEAGDSIFGAVPPGQGKGRKGGKRLGGLISRGALVNGEEEPRGTVASAGTC